MRIQYLDNTAKQNLLENLLKRSPNQYGEYEKAVTDILNRVKEEGDSALFAYTEKFDGAHMDAGSIRVTEAEIEEAYRLV